MKNESLGWKRKMEVHIFFKGLSRPIWKRKEGGPGEKGFMIKTTLSSTSGFSAFLNMPIVKQ